MFTTASLNLVQKNRNGFKKTLFWGRNTNFPVKGIRKRQGKPRRQKLPIFHSSPNMISDQIMDNKMGGERSTRVNN
jgi:hypothetical protein